MALTHTAVATGSPSGAQVDRDEWNAIHRLSGPGLVGRVASGAGNVELLTVGPGLVTRGGELIAGPIRDEIRVSTDFFGSLGEGMFVGGASGTGASNAIVSNNTPAEIVTRQGDGVHQSTTGTTATGRAGLLWPLTNSAVNFNISFGVTARTLEASLWLSAASDATNTFLVRAGFMAQENIIPANGIYFEYDPVANGNQNLWCMSRRDNTQTSVDSGVDFGAATTFQRLRIEVNAAGTSVTFFVNETLVATITTNIMTGSARRTGMAFGIAKSVGTTARLLYADYWRLSGPRVQ